MFKKPFKVKSNSQLKGSDRKKLRSDILQQFPNLTEETLNLICPNKDTIFLLKVLVHSGDIVIIYCVQKLPIIFEIEKVMYPTVYMLWHDPDLLHAFTTHPQVFPFIAGGADLMLPGVILPNGEGLSAYGKLQKGDRVSINLTSNKAPLAVGKAANSSYDMYMSAKRGKCVQVLHYFGDLLSTYGTKLVIPELGPAFNSNNVALKTEEIIPTATESDSVDSVANCLDNINVADELEEENCNSNELGETVTSDSIIEVETTGTDNIEVSPSSTEFMDELVRYCFLKSLRTTMKKVELPLLTSNFYKLHMIPACPKERTLDLKKSSYKKLSNFLNEMVKLGVIQVECLQKGVQSISKIDYSSELVQQFVDNIVDEENETSLVVDNSSTSKSAVPEITEKYTVTATVLPLFYLYDYKKKDAVTSVVVRKVIGDYVKVNNLQNPENRRQVILDEILKNATNVPDDVKVLPWDQLVTNIIGQMGHAFKVEMSDVCTEMAFTKGKLPPIDIHVGTRSGNKKVTLVNNLEIFGINVTEFAKECQHGVAASTTINTLPGAKSAQVQIQGNQVSFVGKILTEKYHIPKRYLRGLENAVKKKK